MVHRQEHKPSHQSHGKEHTLQGSYRRMRRMGKKVREGEGGGGRKNKVCITDSSRSCSIPGAWKPWELYFPQSPQDKCFLRCWSGLVTSYCLIVTVYNDTTAGASAIQLQNHYGWKSANMAMEYVSKSNAALKDVAGLLAKDDTSEKENVRYCYY